MGSKWRGGGVAGGFGPKMGGFARVAARDGIAWRPKRGLDVVAIMVMVMGRGV